MDMKLIVALLPLLPVAASAMLLLKRPFKPSLLSRSMSIALVGFCIFAYLGNDLSQDNDLFQIMFGILTLYCVIAVPAMMYISAALRQAKKRQLQHQAEQFNDK